MSRRRTAWIAVLGAWLGFVALVGREPRAATGEAALALPARCDGAGSLDATLFLVGDAGAPRAPEPLLEALASEVAGRVREIGAGRVAIAFLGDNAYPSGLRPPGHPERAEDERRLGAQLDAVRRSGARGFFVPGNHDWDDGEPGGWEAVRRETRFVAERGASEVPPDGCPGPESAELGAQLSLVFLDTQWWLQSGPRPHDASSGCAATDEASVERALGAALRAAAGRHAVVMAHHPLRSGGPHGGHFGWREHVFPLRELDRSLWIPIPVLGSIRPVARMLGASDQDLTSTAYRELRASVERGLAAAPPLVFATGHDHSLQLIRGGAAARFDAVSGAGSASEVTWAYPIAGTLFAQAQPGYLRLDAFASGAVLLAALEVPARGAPREAFTGCLSSP